MASSRAVWVQAQTPTPMPTAISKSHCPSFKNGSKTKNATHDHKVPTVPGATGDSPLPMPKAIDRAGWPSM